MKKHILIFFVLVFGAHAGIYSQSSPTPAPDAGKASATAVRSEPKTVADPQPAVLTSDVPIAAEPTPTPVPTPNGAVPANDGAAKPKPDRSRLDPARWYVRPTGKQRFKNYIKSTFGPVALIQVVGTGALLTYRNSPTEWGPHWDGFGRRVANSFAKNTIRNTITYGLDEAFKYDSKYYLSRDRSVTARFRNAAFSTVTTRDRNGKRVIGIPRIAGSLVAEVTASTVWYPKRYDYIHGLKGSAIYLAITGGMNLFREFVWKK